MGDAGSLIQRSYIHIGREYHPIYDGRGNCAYIPGGPPSFGITTSVETRSHTHNMPRAKYYRSPPSSHSTVATTSICPSSPSRIRECPTLQVRHVSLNSEPATCTRHFQNDLSLCSVCAGPLSTIRKLIIPRCTISQHTVSYTIVYTHSYILVNNNYIH